MQVAVGHKTGQLCCEFFSENFLLMDTDICTYLSYKTHCMCEDNCRQRTWLGSMSKVMILTATGEQGWIPGYATSSSTIRSVLAVQAPAMEDLALSKEEKHDSMQRASVPSSSSISPLLKWSVSERQWTQYPRRISRLRTQPKRWNKHTSVIVNPKRKGKRRSCSKLAGKIC